MKKSQISTEAGCGQDTLQLKQAELPEVPCGKNIQHTEPS